MTLGVLVDVCRNRFHRDDNPQYGIGIGIMSCFMVTSVCMVTHSVLSAQQVESLAIVSVIIHTIGRVFGTGMFSPLFLQGFPPQFFSFIFGLTLLGSLPFQYLNIPMFNFISDNPE